MANWYQGWKKQLPAEVQQHPRMKQLFTHALRMMNAAATGDPPLPLLQQLLPVSAAELAADQEDERQRRVRHEQRVRELVAEGAAAHPSVAAQSSSSSSSSLPSSSSVPLARQTSAVFAGSAGGGGAEVTLREVLERVALERDWLFASSGRLRGGKQSYLFGGVEVVFERDSVLLVDGGELKPVAYDDLLALAAVQRKSAAAGSAGGSSAGSAADRGSRRQRV